MNEVNNELKTKKPFYKKWWFYLIVVIVLLAAISGSDESTTTPKEKPETTQTKEMDEKSIVKSNTKEEKTNYSKKEELVTYYDRDAAINLYLNRFNSLNPKQLINSDLFTVYYHHGREHDDQIIFYRDDVEVVITGKSYSNSNTVKLVIDGRKEKTNDDYKQLFFQYAGAFSTTLTEEKLNTYWQNVLDDNVNNVEFDEFECLLYTSYNDDIEYMVIEGEIS